MSFDLQIDLDFVPKCTVNQDGAPLFDPRVYQQRYSFVGSVLCHPAFAGQFKKVADFGCAEMRFFYVVKNVAVFVEHLLEIDVDEELLSAHKTRLEPLLVDYISRRKTPLQIAVICGSVSEPNDVLKDTDAVVAIELIEHLNPDVLEGVPTNIFGFVEPKMAVFTTPNADVNGIFPGLEGFRHWDHKFEWTRREFEDWARAICVRFPKYSVAFYGIAPGPEGSESQGCVSQAAVFLRSDMVEVLRRFNSGEKPRDLTQTKNITKEDSPVTGNYKLIASIQYPFEVDERSQEQKVLAEAKYQIQKIKYYEKHEGDSCSETHLFPLEDLMKLVEKTAKSVDELRTVLLSNGFSVINDQVEIKLTDDWSDSKSTSSHAEEDTFDIPEAGVSTSHVDVEEEMW